MTDVVTAAGGVVIRRNSKGKLRVLLVHRPKYDDWGLPKGHADPGETPEQTALREVLEETGYRCRIVAPLGATRYRINSGVKEVHWFAMRPLPSSPGFAPNKEIDGIQWVSKSKANKVMDYENDKVLVAEAGLKGLSQTGTIHLLRHCAAGDRTKWNGDDTLRPLNKKGQRQAAALAEHFGDQGIEKIITSPYTRCVESVEPLARATGAEIEVSRALEEGPRIDAAYDLVDSLVGYNAVLCSHGDVIPAVMHRLMWAGLELESRFYCSKSSVWEVGVDRGRFTTARYRKPPKV